MQLTSAVIRDKFRIRLGFDLVCGSGAFGVSPTAYRVESQDGRGPNPTIRQANLVLDDSRVVELVLSTPLVGSGRYKVYAEGVPGADLSTTPNGTNIEVTFYTRPEVQAYAEQTVDEVAKSLFLVDLIWNGRDFEETSAGDLARVTGPENVSKAIYRGLEVGPLNWDPTWGADLYEYVDSPTPSAGSARSVIINQVLRDPRIKSLKVSVDEKGDGNVVFTIEPTLFSRDNVKATFLTVPTNG